MKHFGEASLHVKNAFGPSRNCRLEKGRNYILSVWVKVGELTPGDNLILSGNYRWLNNSTMPWPIESGLTSNGVAPTPVSVTNTNGDWVYKKLYVPASTDLADEDWDTKYWFFTLFIGNPYGGEAWIDDIRFYPTDGFVASTYYKRNFQIPIVSVNSKNVPGTIIEYDDWARPVKWYKMRHNASPILLKTKTYHIADNQ